MVNLIIIYLLLHCAYSSSWSFSSDIKQVLGSHVVITPQVITNNYLFNLSILVTVIDESNIVKEIITGALIAGSSYKTLQAQQTIMMSQPGWHRRTLLLILTANPTSKMMLNLNLHQERILSVLVSTQSNIYIYNPFIKRLELIVDKAQTALDNMWKNLNGFPIKVVMVSHTYGYNSDLGPALGSGVDGSFLYELSKRWNATIILINQTDYTSARAEMCNGSAELALNNFIIDFANTRFEEITHAVNTETVILVTTDKTMHGWDVFAAIFKWDFWVSLLIVALIINVFLTWILGIKNWRKIFPLTICSLLTVPFNVKNTPPIFSFRCILIFAMLFGEVIIPAHQAILFRFIQSGLQFPRMKTIKELHKSGKYIRVQNPFLKNFFFTTSEGIFKAMTNKVIVDSNLTGFYYTDVVLIKKSDFEFRKFTEGLSNRIYSLKQNLRETTVVYTTKRGSSYLDPLNKFVLQVLEGGFLKYWQTLSLDKNRKKINNKSKSDSNEEGRRVLSLRDIEVAFFALTVGEILSVLVFFIEFYLQNTKNNLEEIRIKIKSFIIQRKTG